MFSFLVAVGLGAVGYRFYCKRVCTGRGSSGCLCGDVNKS